MSEPKVARDAEERGEGICRTCLAPIWNEGGTIGRRERDTGWSDRIERCGDSLVCFKAVEYRHVPLKGREAEIYDVALARGAGMDGEAFDRWRAAALDEQGETGWRDVVLSREKGDEGDWEVTVWTPSEIGEARGQFPDFEYVLGKAMWMPVPDTTGAESEGKA